MNQTMMNEKSVSQNKIESINRVEGFDPAPFAVDYTDLSTGEVRKRLPVMIQMAWFRMKYPEGKIAVSVSPGKECFIATARIYPHYKDGESAYLAEATASRSFLAEKPSVSPREWAQTAAVGIALRNAGFGLQFSMAGEEPGLVRGEAPLDPSEPKNPTAAETAEPSGPREPETIELTEEQRLEMAMRLPCPIAKYKGKTLGDMVGIDPRSLVWIANRYTGSAEVAAAAKLICESAVGEPA